MKPAFVKILEPLIASENATAKDIKKGFMDGFKNFNLPNGTLLPLPTDVATYLRVSRAIALDAYKQLEDGKKLVRKDVDGRYIIDITNNRIDAKKIESHGRQILFNCTFVHGSNDEAVKVNNEFKMYTAVYHNKRSVIDWSMVGHAVASQLLAKVNADSLGRYKINNIAFASDYIQLVHTIGDTIVTERKAVVLPDYAPGPVVRAFKAACKNVKWVGSDAEGEWLKELEAWCKTGNILLFYMSSRSFYPFIQQTSIAVLQSLLALQEQYHNFTIVEDDHFAGSWAKSPNLFMELILEKKANVIYIKPVSYFNGPSSEMHLLAAPYHLRDKIVKQLTASGKLISREMTYSLYRVLDGSVLRSAEARIVKFGKISFEKAIRFFNTPGLALRCIVHDANGWFLYLEPVDGYFADDIYERLKNHNIHVINPAAYGQVKNKHPGIVIALGDYLKDDNALEKDLGELLWVATTMIIN